MKVELQRVDDAFHFKAVGSAGVAIDIDANAASGGKDAGARPMELLLMGLGSCSAIDIIIILKKQQQQIDDFKIVIDGERYEGETPSVFKSIRVHYILKGKIEPSKVQRAIDLSFEKYCSVAAILYKTATIEHSFEIIQ